MIGNWLASGPGQATLCGSRTLFCKELAGRPPVSMETESVMIKEFRFSVLAASCAAVALYAAPPAFAGEVNGRGLPIPATDHAASLCAFSGLNDHPVNPPPGDFPGKVQNFGAFLNFLADLFGFRINPLDAPSYPGVGCNPNSDITE